MLSLLMLFQDPAGIECDNESLFGGTPELTSEAAWDLGDGSEPGSTLVQGAAPELRQSPGNCIRIISKEK